MKNNKFTKIFISFFLFLLMPLTAYADNGYSIENYKVDIKVNENNVINIKETIETNFEYEKHGIIRNIPTKNKFDRRDFDTTNKAKIKNMSITDERGIPYNYRTTCEDGTCSYKIGDSYKTLTGNHTYVISYDYDFGDDNIDEYDEFYFNIIGTQWDTYSENVDFTITMPKDFDETKVNFTVGYYGATYYEDVVYEIKDNVIKGTLLKDKYNNHALSPREGLTVRIELPEGYFKGERKVIDPTFALLIAIIVFSIIFLLINTRLFIKYGKGDKFILVPEFTVPDDLTPAEIGYLYKGTVDNKHIVSLITYFANKGYLQIIKTNRK